MSIREIQNSRSVTFEALACCISGKKIRKRFKTKGAAEQWAKAKRRERDRDRYQVLMIPDGLRPELVKAQEILEPYHISILEAARHYVRTFEGEVNHASAPWTFGEACRHCLQHRMDSGARKFHLNDLRAFYGRVSYRFGEEICDEIKTEDLVGYVRNRNLSPQSWRNYRAKFSTVFSFAIEQGRATRNPAKAMPFPRLEDAPVKILRVEEVKRFLAACDLRTKQYAGLGLFCGLRPFELTNVVVVPDMGCVTVSAASSKSRRRRHVTLPDNLRKLFTPSSAVAFSEKYRPIRRLFVNASKASGVVLSDDIFRHSFASHHLALHRNAALTAEMGHADQDMLFRHYRELVTYEEGKAYFDISL